MDPQICIYQTSGILFLTLDTERSVCQHHDQIVVILSLSLSFELFQDFLFNLKIIFRDNPLGISPEVIIEFWDFLYSVFIQKTKGDPHGPNYCSSFIRFLTTFLISIGHKEHPQTKKSDAEVMTAALIAARYFGGNQQIACAILKTLGYIPNIL